MNKTEKLLLQQPDMLIDEIDDAINAIGFNADICEQLLATFSAQLATKPTAAGGTMQGFLNGAYACKSNGNGAGIFSHTECLIILFAVDRGAKMNFLVAMGYRTAGTAPSLNIVASHGLSLGAGNLLGTQVVNGGNGALIITYGISIPFSS